MEPMTLGSPVQSPVHLGQQPSFSAVFQSPAGQPAFHSTAYNSVLGQGTASTPLGNSQMPHSPVVAAHPAGTPGFLPGYLMGQFPQQSPGRVVSPTKLNRSVNSCAAGGAGSTPTAPGRQNNGFLTPTTTPHVRTPAEKPGGPPIKGLYAATTPNQGNKGTPKFGGLAATPLNSTPQLSFGGTPGGLRDEDLVEGVANEGTTWVTVFGFPPSASSYMLSQFSQCGTILQHHIPPHGNWMTIRFQTKMQAQKAIGRSGRVLGGTLMIGVVPCHDPPAEAANASSANLDQTTADTSVLSLNSSLAPHNRSIRPLTQSYKAANKDHDVSLLNNTPNKNSGIVGKAMGCIFGW